MKSVLDATKSSTKNKSLGVLPAVPLDSISEKNISSQDNSSQNVEIPLVPSFSRDELGLDEDPFVAEPTTAEEDLGLRRSFADIDQADEDELGLNEDPFAVAKPQQ